MWVGRDRSFRKWNVYKDTRAVVWRTHYLYLPRLLRNRLVTLVQHAEVLLTGQLQVHRLTIACLGNCVLDVFGGSGFLAKAWVCVAVCSAQKVGPRYDV